MLAQLKSKISSTKNFFINLICQLKKNLLSFKKELYRQKLKIIKNFLIFLILVLASFLVEYFAFNYPLNWQPKKIRTVFSIKNEFISAKDFSLNENGELVSQKENATLTIQTGSKYIQDLQVEISKNIQLPLFAKFTDPKTGGEIVSANNLQSFINEEKIKQWDRLFFKIQNNPKEITLQAVQPGIAISAIKIDNTYTFNQNRFLFLLGALVLVWILFSLRKEIGEKPQLAFLAIALICGSLISFTEPRAMVSWDERDHYLRADDHSYKNIIGKNSKDIYSFKDIPYSYSIKEQKAIDEYFDAQYQSKIKKDGGGRDTELSIINFYQRLVYKFSGTFIAFGRLIGLPYHLIFSLGRVVNLWIFAFLIFFAIKKLHSGKIILSIIALFPTTIFLAANYNYDSWTIGFTTLGLAYLFSEIQNPDKKISAKDLAIIIGSIVVGLGPKAIYFPLLFLVFLLKKEKFSSTKQHYRFILINTMAIIFVVGSFMWPFLAGGAKETAMRSQRQVSPSGQVKFILFQPISYAKILLPFLGEYLSPENFKGFTVSMAYLKNTNGFLFILILLIVVIFTDKNSFDCHTSNFKTRFWILISSLFTIVLITTAIYIDFNELKRPQIIGVQARYLLPLLFPISYIIGSSQIKNEINKIFYNGMIFAFMALILLGGIWNSITKFYW